MSGISCLVGTTNISVAGENEKVPDGSSDVPIFEDGMDMSGVKSEVFATEVHVPKVYTKETPGQDINSYLLKRHKLRHDRVFVPPLESEVEQIRHPRGRDETFLLPVTASEKYLDTSELNMDKIHCSQFIPPVSFVSYLSELYLFCYSHISRITLKSSCTTSTMMYGP
jgi:hypothetical protein